MTDLPTHPSESFKRRNPHLYPVARLVAAKREPNQKPALEQEQKMGHSQCRCAGIIVTLIAARQRVLDDDNSIAGFKCLRDAIARSFGIDDADPRIRFEYGQVRSDRPGTIVKIERI